MNVSTLSRRVIQLLPKRRALRTALAGKSLALCMHRVHWGVRRSGEALPEMSISEDALDALIGELLEATAGTKGTVTVSFDDGYRDAAEYVARRAKLFTDVRFLLFLCPQKVEQRRGFSWDFRELTGRGESFGDRLEAELAAGAHPDFALATVAECEALKANQNVELGNHTNRHLRSTTLTMNEAHAELLQSSDDFRRLFGELRHFAFPFGVPGEDFDARHLALLAQVAPGATAWSTQPGAFDDQELRSGAALPRFSVDGTLRIPEVLSRMILQLGRERVLPRERISVGA